jgi:hypothetical protein
LPFRRRTVARASCVVETSRGTMILRAASIDA